MKFLYLRMWWQLVSKKLVIFFKFNQSKYVFFYNMYSFVVQEIIIFQNTQKDIILECSN